MRAGGWQPEHARWPWPPHVLYGCDRDHGHGLRVAMAITALVVSVAVADDIASVAMSVLDYVVSAVPVDVMGVGGGRG